MGGGEGSKAVVLHLLLRACCLYLSWAGGQLQFFILLSWSVAELKEGNVVQKRL